MSFSQAQSIEDNEMLHLIEVIMGRDASRHAWLSTQNINDNLELLYTVHLPTT